MTRYQPGSAEGYDVYQITELADLKVGQKVEVYRMRKRMMRQMDE